MADVFVALGAAVVKAGVKVWLKDNDFAADASASLTDLISGRISDEYDRRKARRIFEDLEEPVVKRLKSLRQTEFGSLPQNEWNAAVIAAGETFGRSQLTAAELFTRDLDPLFLERHIRQGNPKVTRDLSEGGAGLYDRLISEGCAYVIEIADKLPHFQASAFAELLHRDRQIVELVTEVLDRIPSQAQGRSEEARFVTACRRRIATKLDRLTLLGLDFELPWHPLTVAYVSLRTEQSSRLRAEQPESSRTDELSDDSPAVEQRLAASPRLLLLGRAGSGKTTVLQWYAVNAARGSFTGPLAGLNEHFPFYLRLREFPRAKLPGPREFLTSTAPLMLDEAPDGWARRQLDSGRALVLIDGVDEVAASDRDRVADWLRELVERFPAARYVVTARPEAVPSGWLADTGFDGCSLEPMPPSVVDVFIRNWYEASRQRQADDEERAQLDRYEDALRSAVTRDRYLRDLADTPLLAGLLCALNLHLRSNLPRRRTEIYERALAMFDQRDRARGLAPDSLSLDLTAKTQLLADLALWMVRNGQTEVEFEAAEAQLRRSFSSLAATQSTPPGDGLGRHLLERSGLLREPSAGSVDFVHRTFQEYLAARAAIDADAIGELVGNAGNDQWGEVVVLAAGQANQVQARRLIKELLKRSWRDRHPEARRVLAVASLQEIRSIDHDVRQEVAAVIRDLLPPRSMLQAEQLAASGPPLIPLLAAYWARDSGLAPETIRAASLVGGSAAMDLISEIIGQRGSKLPVMEEACRAWQYFDTAEFARRVLAGHSIAVLPVSGTKYLTALREVPGLRALIVDPDHDGGIDMAAVAELSQVTSLVLRPSSRPLDLQPLALCPQLRALTISSYRHDTVRVLSSRLAALGSLSLDAAPRLLSLESIDRFRRLIFLEVRGCARLRLDWVHLRELPLLREVNITGPQSVELSGFRHTGGVMRLRLSGCGEVDLRPLAGNGPVEVVLGSGTAVRDSTMPANVRVTHLESVVVNSSVAIPQ